MEARVALNLLATFAHAVNLASFLSVLAVTVGTSVAVTLVAERSPGRVAWSRFVAVGLTNFLFLHLAARHASDVLAAAGGWPWAAAIATTALVPASSGAVAFLLRRLVLKSERGAHPAVLPAGMLERVTSTCPSCGSERPSRPLVCAKCGADLDHQLAG